MPNKPDINSKEFLTWLWNEKIRSYRLEALTDFAESPTFLLGDGLRHFDIISLLFPVVNVGPTGYPVPGGSFVELDGTPRFPVDSRISRDVFVSMDTRIRHQNDCKVTGEEVIPESANENWHSQDVEITLVAGAAANQTLLAAGAGEIPEIDITYINIQPIDDVACVNMKFVFAAAAGSLSGHRKTITLSYRNDLANSNLVNQPHIEFYNGKRMMANTASDDIRVSITGGLGGEKLVIGFNYRILPG